MLLSPRERLGVLTLTAALVVSEPRLASAQLAPIEGGTDVTLLLSRPRSLHLAVTVNGHVVEGTQPFMFTPPHILSAERRVLEGIGIAVPGKAASTDLVELDALPSEVTYRYDEATQIVAFLLPDGRRQRRAYDVRNVVPYGVAPTPDWGGYLNYTAFASETRRSRSWSNFSGVNASLDAHVFGPFGALDQSAILGNTIGRQNEAFRLETGYSYLDQDRMLVTRVGDTVSSGLAWSRPIRLGGIQIQRDFALQPGLVTQPLPSYSGSAAVPSMVDVFVGSNKLFSQHVDPGPFELLNIPSVTNGTGSVVVTDATGRQTKASLPLYNVAALLQPDLTDFSLEAGFARRNFGLASDDYDERPVMSATARRGLTPALTLEGHAEAGAGVVNGGMGAIAGTPWGTLESAVSFSQQRKLGAQLYAGYDLQFWAGVMLHTSAQARTDAFDDLAGATARWKSATSGIGLLSASISDNGLQSLAAYRPSKRLNEFSASVPLPFGCGTANASLIDQITASDAHVRILSLSVSHPLPFQASLFATAFLDLAGRGGSGLLAGLNVPLGTDATVSLGSGIGDGSGSTAIAQKPMGQEAGSTGWQIASLGSSGEKLATGDYRSSVATVSAGVTETREGLGGVANLEGSIGVVGGTVALGNRIQDGFAIVDAGLPGVAVLQDNRHVGNTDPWGHYLVSGLSTYQENRIAIDPLTMPVHADATSNQATVVPARASGVRVDFGGQREESSSLLVIVDGAGKPLPPGSKGRMDGSNEEFMVGYDGQAYVRHLNNDNAGMVDTGAGECRLAFSRSAMPQPGATDRRIPCL